MRFLTTAALVLAAIVVPASAATSNKQVQNMKGSVSYQKPNKAAKPIASQASIGLADKDITITGEESLAGVTLPDSSHVLVGSDSKVQLAFFNQTSIANAKFVIYQGKFRFKVEHPNGAQANYVFQTPSAQIGVRGTEGDIGVDEDGSVRVNVYALSDPNLPVQVTTKDGKSFVLNAGQSLLTQYANGILQEQVQKLDDQIVGQFSPDFGVPTNWEQLKQTLMSQARSKLCQFSPIC